MFEHITFDGIMEQMLDNVPSDMDTREGSILWNALAPVAAELQTIYIDMDELLEQTFADTALGEFLEMRCAERGIYPYPATKAVLKAEFNRSVEIGSRFSGDGQNYTVTEQIEDLIYRMECEVEGAAGNRYIGEIIPVNYIEGLESAKLVEVLLPGEDAEEPEHLRQRYFNSLDKQTFAGNVADYKRRVNELDGISSVKVYPIWKGGGTVRLVILDSEYKKPSAELVQKTQNAVDPPDEKGLGIGIAPIGHVVTVEAVQYSDIDIKTEIAFADGWDFEQAREQIEQTVDDYLLELAKTWEQSERLVVRISQIETRILDLEPVIDVMKTSINGESENYTLGEDEIPKRGEMIA